MIVYRAGVDVQVYVVASNSENEVIVASVLQALYGALSLLTNGLIEKHTLLEHYDACVLAVDELVDDGVILETDPERIHERLSTHETNMGKLGADNSLSQALASAREQISRSLLH